MITIDDILKNHKYELWCGDFPIDDAYETPGELSLVISIEDLNPETHKLLIDYGAIAAVESIGYTTDLKNEKFWKTIFLRPATKDINYYIIAESKIIDADLLWLTMMHNGLASLKSITSERLFNNDQYFKLDLDRSVRYEKIFKNGREETTLVQSLFGQTYFPAMKKKGDGHLYYRRKFERS